MGMRPQTPFVKKLKARRCGKCGAALNRQLKRCKKCHSEAKRPKK